MRFVLSRTVPAANMLTRGDSRSGGQLAETLWVHKIRAAAVVGLTLPLWLSASAVAGASTTGLLPIPAPVTTVGDVLPAPVSALLPTPVASLLGSVPTTTGAPSDSASPSASPAPSDSASASPTASPSATADPLAQILSIVTGVLAPSAPVAPPATPSAGAASAPSAAAASTDSTTGTTGSTRTPDVAALVTTHSQRIVKAALPQVASAHHAQGTAAVPVAAVVPVISGTFVLPATVGSPASYVVASPQLAGDEGLATLPDTDTPATVLATQAVEVAQAQQHTTNQVSTGLAAVALVAVMAAAGAQIPARRRLRRR